MLLAPHILVGAAVASRFQNPLLGIVFAFLSHFLLDSIPHWEYSIKELRHIKTKGIRYCMPIFLRIVLDITTGIAILIIALYFGRNEIPFSAWALGGFFAILPDGITFLGMLKPRNKIILFFINIVHIPHHAIHFDKKTRGLPPLRIGLSTQAITMLLALYFLIF